MVRTWLADVSALLEKEKYCYYYKRVPEERQRKADRIAAQEGKALSVGAWILFQRMREEYELGKDVVYNLSHSGKYALCSVDDSGDQNVQLGCDIEEIKQLRLRVAKHFFCESEIRSILNQETEQQQREVFYRYWVLKESFMKATRLGMKLGLDQFEIKIEEGKVPYLVRQPDAFQGKYYYQEYKIENIPYRMAVCTSNSDISKEVCKIIL